jgi:hypothetical protein
MKTLLTFIVGFGMICCGSFAQTNKLPAVTPQLYSCGFHLDSEDLRRLRSQVPPTTGETTQNFFLRYFKANQIEIKAPESLRFEPSPGVLFVRMTLTKLDKIENLLSKPRTKD